MSDSNFTLLVICGGVTDQERQRRIEEIQWYAANNELISSTHVRWLLDQLAAALADRATERARFDWFFGPQCKTSFLETYMRGVREDWTVDQWRAALDAARGGQNGE